jgi:crotonobetainyl-CoA:carnitine CoA-transferase CaiB-like acyl-CoA transferase
MENTGEATALLEEIFASATLADWCERLASFQGQWCVVQDTLEAAEDPQTTANGYLQECHTADGTAFRLVTVPVQYDEEPARPSRAPEFNEHGDQILGELGLDMDAILDLKVRGVVT